MDVNQSALTGIPESSLFSLDFTCVIHRDRFN